MESTFETLIVAALAGAALVFAAAAASGIVGASWRGARDAAHLAVRRLRERLGDTLRGGAL